jgi:hypothetical protein
LVGRRGGSFLGLGVGFVVVFPLTMLASGPVLMSILPVL